MGKDPAFLFYYQDYMVGTRKMSLEEKGAYMDLLCEQADSGHFDLQDVERILKPKSPIWESIWGAIWIKFRNDADGRYYNERLEKELIKRRKYTESRQNNLSKPHMGSHMDRHMDNHMGGHMEDRNRNKDEDGIKDKNGDDPPSWRTNIEIYKEIVSQAHTSLINDVIELQKQERLNPGVDVLLSLEKAIHNFWGTEAGWKHKKKSKSKEIDMHATLINAIPLNKVYKPRQQFQPRTVSDQSIKGILTMDLQ